jgi:predicted nucleic acid-binding protein
MQFLVDTGVWLRLFDRTDPHHTDIQAALRLLRNNGHTLAVCPQNIAEFWSVSTRPAAARGGYGKSVATTERRVQFIERFASLLDESPAAYREWRLLVTHHQIQGASVHDARLVAMMQTAGVAHILTLNASDFARYPTITVTTPGDLFASANP